MNSTVHRLARSGALELLAVAVYCMATTMAQAAEAWGPFPGDFDATAMLATQRQPLDLSGAMDSAQVAELTNYGYQVYNKSGGGLIELNDGLR
jgi:hypothetical protein